MCTHPGSCKCCAVHSEAQRHERGLILVLFANTSAGRVSISSRCISYLITRVRLPVAGAFKHLHSSVSEGDASCSPTLASHHAQNKTLRVRRVWDAARKTLLYIAYSTHTSGGHHDDDAGRYRTSICALPLAGNAEAVQTVQ